MRPQLQVKPVIDGIALFKAVQKPATLRSKAMKEIYPQHLEAVSRWFDQNSSGFKTLRGDYWNQYASHPVQMELSQTIEPRFSRFDAPLGLFLNWQRKKQDSLASNQAQPENGTSLYIAQNAIESLPQELQRDLPTPTFIATSDIYNSSLWLGLPPTHTPLHRDPNDNLFVQLSGSKRFRLLSPEDGTAVIGDRKIRLEEDLMSEQTAEIEEWLWSSEHGHDDNGDDTGMICLEAEVAENEGMYIPRGWWHSVRSIGKGVNTSANWWFRPR